MENQPATEQLGFRRACMLHDVPRAGCSRARPPRLSRVSQCRLLPGPLDAAVSATPPPRCPGLAIAVAGRRPRRLPARHALRNFQVAPASRLLAAHFRCAARGRRRHPLAPTRPCTSARGSARGSSQPLAALITRAPRTARAHSQPMLPPAQPDDQGFRGGSRPAFAERICRCPSTNNIWLDPAGDSGRRRPAT